MYMDLFRKIFGLNLNDDQHNQYRRPPQASEEDRDSSLSDDPFTRRSFDVFSDPIQMHQYFEQQMNEVLKMFGFNGAGEFSIGFPNSPLDNWSQTPTDGENENTSKNVRDQFLKPGYERPKTHHSDMVDKDLDEKVKLGDLSSVLGETFDKQVKPYEAPKPRSFFYGTSHSMKTITNADGTIESHRTTRDNEGNEETTVCHKIGNKEYCVIKKKDKYGKEEITENFVNMTENEKDIFAKSKNNPKIRDENNTPDIPWSKFF